MIFNAAAHRQLQPQIIEAIKAIGDAYGIEFVAAGGRYGSESLVFNIKAIIADKSAQEELKRQEFARSCHRYGLEPDDYGLEFTSNFRRFKVVGFKSSRPKYPLECFEEASGKTYKFSRLSSATIQAAREQRDRAKVAESVADLVSSSDNEIYGSF